MNQVEDVLADVEMYFCQLIDLLDLMIENDMNNFMTLKQLLESGLNSIKSFKN